MRKFIVKIGDNFKSDKPYIQLDWDYDMIGDELRKRFDTYLEEYKVQNGIVKGGEKVVLVPKVLANFMIRQRINLVDDPTSGGLKSVFILKVGEEKTVDERCKTTLENRYGRKKIVDPSGITSDDLGFLEFIEVGVKKLDPKVDVPEIKGEDVKYFDDTEEAPKEKEVEEEKVGFSCETCGKTFDKRQQLVGHMLWHKREAKNGRT